jgi:DNA processing protein
MFSKIKYKKLTGLSDRVKMAGVEFLYSTGDLLEKDYKSIAVVGTRSPTNYGEAVVKTLVSDLASCGIVILSGLAFGIDALAHEACISVGGRTVAVLGSGHDSIMPKSNESLAHKIIDGNYGVVVSQFEPSIQGLKWNFIKRDRLMAAISDSVLVIEAGENSGTSHTVEAALEFGKTVFCVPGSIFSPQSMGTNKYIKEGAIPVTCAQDIFDELGESLIESPAAQPKSIAEAQIELMKKSLTQLELKIFEALSVYPLSINELALKLNEAISKVLIVITELEVKGLVKVNGNMVSR